MDSTEKIILAVAGIGTVAGVGFLATRASSSQTPGVTITEKILSQGQVYSVSGLVPLTVVFTATVTGGVSPYTYSWNWGDATPNGTGNPSTHTFSVSSTTAYTVTVTVTDSIGNVASGTDTVTASQSATTLALSAQLSGPLFNAETGSSIVLVVTLANTPSGYVSGATISFYQGTTLLGTATTNSSGGATLTVTAPSTAGNITFSAAFAGNADFKAANSNSLTIPVYAPLQVTVGP